MVLLAIWYLDIGTEDCKFPRKYTQDAENILRQTILNLIG